MEWTTIYLFMASINNWCLSKLSYTSTVLHLKNTQIWDTRFRNSSEWCGIINIMNIWWILTHPNGNTIIMEAKKKDIAIRQEDKKSVSKASCAITNCHSHCSSLEFSHSSLVIYWRQSRLIMLGQYEWI